MRRRLRPARKLPSRPEFCGIARFAVVDTKPSQLCVEAQNGTASLLLFCSRCSSGLAESLTSINIGRHTGLKQKIPGISPRLPEEQFPPRDAAPPEARRSA
jgi:N-acyl-L-homoserine lactone synthetase